jgi:hypothetical protein
MSARVCDRPLASLRFTIHLCKAAVSKVPPRVQLAGSIQPALIRTRGLPKSAPTIFREETRLATIERAGRALLRELFARL